ncbi:MAG TPA: AraD1 family protein [Roseiarcus sp.]|nr:AraD1 family protein [Roseiarcus sp.]
MRLAQFVDENGKRALAVTARGESRMVRGARSTLDLARQAIAEEVSLRKLIADRGVGKSIDLHRALKERRVLPPIDHKDPAHVFVTGTGLTHLGSAEGRDQMHRDLADPAKLTDSMRMFRLGLDGGKPGRGETGAQPEWFYKGDGSILVAPEGDLKNPSFALDGGEEPEIVGVYVVDDAGRPVRIGFALGNEFSDHVTERQNYLWLAHSKLRPASVGPELLVGDLPADVQGVSRIRRGRELIWEKPFLSGEQNMAHSIANLEAHHFKYALFRRPGDVHVHFFGTATLSFSANVQTQKGDVLEIESEPFGLPLRNRLRVEKAGGAKVRAL